MKWYLTILLCPLFLPVELSTQVISTLEAAIFQADQLAHQTFEKENLPGMAIAVAKNGETVWAKGFGFADLQKKIPVDPYSSKFRIGSISKTFTAIALMQLEEEGKIHLDENVRSYVPAFTEKRWPVTVRQVAQHVGGIRHYKGDEFMMAQPYGSVAESLQIFQEDTLLFEPGTQYAYSSYGWNLISAVIEQACGMSFLEYMQTHVFQPAGMLNSGPDFASQDIPGRVSFYYQNDNQENLAAPYVDNSYKWAGGGFLSTAADLIIFADAVMDHKILSDQNLKKSLIPYTLKNGKQTNYGLGWMLDVDKKGRSWIGHGGGSVGGSSMFLIFPDTGITVVTLVNLSQARTGNLPFRIAEQFLTYYEGQ